MAKLKITLKDIAEKAGVSVATTSMALHNHPRIGEKTKVRVREIASRLAYVPDPKLAFLMQYLRSDRNSQFTEIIGFLNAYRHRGVVRQLNTFRGLLQGAEAYATPLGYKIENLWLGEEGMTDKRMNDILRSRNIRGLILPPHPENHAHIRLDWGRLVVVSHGLSIDEPAVHCICSHHFFDARLAYQNLWNLGYRRIGFAVHKSHDDRTEHLWTGGFLSASREVSDRCRISEYIGPSSEAFVKWFGKCKPEALIIAKMDFKKILESNGIHAPGDCAFAYLNLASCKSSSDSVTGAVPAEYHDSGYAGSSLNPGELAGIIQKHEEFGKIAAGLVVGALQQNKLGLPESPHRIVVKGYWVDGKSAPRK